MRPYFFVSGSTKTDARRIHWYDQLSLSIPFQCGLSEGRRKRELSTNIRDVLEQYNVKKIRELLNNPPGTFTPDMMDAGKRFLDLLEDFPDAETVNTSIRLWERLVLEISLLSEDDSSLSMLCNPHFFNETILKKWRKTAQGGGKVIAPLDVVRIFHSVQKQVSQFRCDMATYGIILDVLIRTTEPEKAPKLAEDLLESVHKETEKSSDPDETFDSSRPNVYLYSQVVQAYILSGRKDAPIKIELLLDRMRKQAPPDEITYNMVIRYYAGRGLAERMQNTLETMSQENIKASVLTLSQAIHGYVKADQLKKAEDLFEQMLVIYNRKSRNHQKSVGESAHSLLVGYRYQIESETADDKEKETAFVRAQALIRNIRENAVLGERWIQRLEGMLIEMYALDGQFVAAEEIFNKYPLDPVKCSILIKCYGRWNQPELATESLQRMLEKSNHLKPNIFAFNALIDAWARSNGKPDAVEKAFSVLKQLEEYPHANPDTVTFNTLLKCLLWHSLSSDAGQRAEAIIDEMQRRQLSGDHLVQLDDVSFITAIKCCLVAKDLVRAKLMVDRMEKSGISLSKDTYVEIIDALCSMQFAVAMDFVEYILSHMRLFAITRGPSLKPDKTVYETVLHGYAKSGHPKTVDRMRNIIDVSKNEKVALNFSFYARLIEQVKNSL
jgi:pentatricopeptide repeat protein